MCLEIIHQTRLHGYGGLKCQTSGDLVIVEVDETKTWEKIKTSRERTEGVWVLVGVEIPTNRKCFFLSFVRTANTPKRVISILILPGSIIYKNGWQGYESTREDINFECHVLSHTQWVKDPMEGHTLTLFKVAIMH